MSGERERKSHQLRGAGRTAENEEKKREKQKRKRSVADTMFLWRFLLYLMTVHEKLLNYCETLVQTRNGFSLIVSSTNRLGLVCVDGSNAMDHCEIVT